MSANAARGPRLPTPPFTGATIDRVAELRHDAPGLLRLLATGEPRAIACDARGNIAVDRNRRALARTPWQGDPADAILLGIERGRPLVAIDLPDPDSDPGRPEIETMPLREIGLALPRAEGGLAAYLVALTNWHRKHGFCSVCGARTRLAEGGASRHCPSCGATHFPRTDPVVIMTVESEGRLLMGSRNGWPPERYSVLAGFVASGETPEEAVIREVKEESGVDAHSPRYVAAQPWPFPASLMLGFHAQAEGGTPVPGGDEEMSDVRWFPRDEVVAMQHGDSELQLPGEVSIARILIDHWVLGG